jgi:hypothetical protein
LLQVLLQLLQVQLLQQQQAAGAGANVQVCKREVLETNREILSPVAVMRLKKKRDYNRNDKGGGLLGCRSK